MALQELLSLALPCDLHAPGRVRRELDRVEEINPVRANATLLASELVSNAVLHSGCGPEHEIQVGLRLGGDVLEISVHDPGLSDSDPEVAGDRDVGGLGLLLLDRLADRWGVAVPDGRLVWAQLPLAVDHPVADGRGGG